jgi:O-methyltransferase
MFNFETTNKVLSQPNSQIDPTITSIDQIKYLLSLLETTLDDDIIGDVVELGCYIGESSKWITMMMIEKGSKKKLCTYDSFEGLPEPGPNEPEWRKGSLSTTQQVFCQNYINNQLPIPNIYKCWFNEITDEMLPDKISFAFFDGDFYQSIYDSLQKVYPKLSKGAIVCFHDYERWNLPGVKKAVDDFFEQIGKKERIQFKICDQLGVYIHED